MDPLETAEQTVSCCVCGKFADAANHDFSTVSDYSTGSPIGFVCSVTACISQIDGTGGNSGSGDTTPAPAPQSEPESVELPLPEKRLPPCDICGSNNQAPTSTRYALKRTKDKYFIGPHECTIFSGQIKTGYCCNGCYQRNRRRAKRADQSFRGEAHSEDDVWSPPRSLRKRQCLETIDETEPLAQPPATQLPVPVIESVPAQLVAANAVLPQPQPPSLEKEKQEKNKDVASDIVNIVETMLEIEDARSNTVTMMATIGRVLSRRSTVTAALTNSADGVFDAETFVSMQSYFLRMLQSQLVTIQKDQRLYADKLVEATNKPSP